ncbi:hypothetical protein [Methanimicrococcus hacksteinii]|uniref:hypothetical protein n=1 Tax=Methanimicrococcus hacksteinii TaxID=3028293 RepID=UPI00298F1D96|nr:hypothetical protein [Methanimicrococcus sp. At1]
MSLCRYLCAFVPCVSSHFYHIRSLRERGHGYLPVPFARLPADSVCTATCRFRLHGYLPIPFIRLPTGSVCTATYRFRLHSYLPIPFAHLPTVSVCAVTLPISFARLPTVSVCAVTLPISFAQLPTVSVCAVTLPVPVAQLSAVSVNTVAALQACFCHGSVCARVRTHFKRLKKSDIGFYRKINQIWEIFFELNQFD